MDVELLYHPHDSDEATGSPFEERIVQVTQNAPANITCPYLSLEILHSISDSADSWRLITDVQEWVRTQPTATRENILRFVRQNPSRIHDCRDLHAKTIITEAHPLLGSANFTKTGLRKNTELGILFHQTDQVRELQEWFEQLWTQTNPVNEDHLRKYLEHLNSEESDRRESASMPATGPTIDVARQPLTRQDPPVDESAHERLVQRAGEAPNRAWMNRYFDWVAELFDHTGLTEDDPSVALTIPKSKNRLPVNVNQRYVLTGFPDKGLVGFMLPGDSTAVDTYPEYISDFGSFSTSDGKDPYWFEFPDDPEKFITPAIKQDWKRAVETEYQRASRSKYRDKHEPAVYNAATDIQYRIRVLNDAFE